MGQIEAVLFDYGLVISAPPLPSAWERMKAISGLDEATLHAAYWAHRHAYDRGTHTGQEFWHLAAKHAGGSLDDKQVEELQATDIDLWGDLNQPMVDWIWGLQKAGVKTGILSNMGDAMADGLSAKYDWLGNFDHKVWSYALKLAKPEAEIYRHAVEGLGVSADRVLFVDDKAENIAAAEAAGLQGIVYGEHGVFEREMRERGWGSCWRFERIPPTHRLRQRRDGWGTRIVVASTKSRFPSGNDNKRARRTGLWLKASGGLDDGDCVGVLRLRGSQVREPLR